MPGAMAVVRMCMNASLRKELCCLSFVKAPPGAVESGGFGDASSEPESESLVSGSCTLDFFRFSHKSTFSVRKSDVYCA